MIYQSNVIIDCIDTKDGFHGSISIDELLARYYHELRLDPVCAAGIKYRFRRPNIYIKDWNGWTEILSISKCGVSNDTKLYIIGNDDESVILNDEPIVPVYDEVDIKNPFIGFHGEAIYGQTLKSPKDITEDDYIRYYGNKILSGNGFIHTEVKEYICPHEGHYMYNIETRSKYFNLNNFYLF